MSLTGICSPESARRKFFMNYSTSCLESRNEPFCAQEAVMSLTGICSRESAIRKFFMKSKYIMS